jgi:hypothetical protein
MFLPGLARGWRPGVGRGRGGLEQRQRGGDALVAGGDLRLIGIVERDRLRQGEPLFRPVVALQRWGDLLNGAPATPVTAVRQHPRIVRPGEDGTDDRHPGLTGEVRYYLRQLQIHRRQRLLQVLHVLGGIIEYSD